MRLLAAAVLLALPGVGGAQIYKCQVDGKTIYSQRPCAAAAEEMKVNTAVPDPGQGAAGLRPQEILEDAVAQRKVMVGMSPDQVRRAWGRPTAINRSVATYGASEQWVYRRNGAADQYVYFDDGVVSSIQG